MLAARSRRLSYAWCLAVLINHGMDPERHRVHHFPTAQQLTAIWGGTARSFATPYEHEAKPFFRDARSRHTAVLPR